MVVETGPETMPEEPVFNKGETPVNGSDSVADKWISHNAPPFYEPYPMISSGAIESFFARFYYPVDIGIIFTFNASIFTRLLLAEQMK
jgi:hypothetical protein